MSIVSFKKGFIGLRHQSSDTDHLSGCECVGHFRFDVPLCGATFAATFQQSNPALQIASAGSRGHLTTSCVHEAPVSRLQDFWAFVFCQIFVNATSQSYGNPKEQCKTPAISQHHTIWISVGFTCTNQRPCIFTASLGQIFFSGICPSVATNDGCAPPVHEGSKFWEICAIMAPEAWKCHPMPT